MSKFAGKLPRTFIKLRILERRTHKHEEEQAGGDLCEQDVSPDVCSERV